MKRMALSALFPVVMLTRREFARDALWAALVSCSGCRMSAAETPRHWRPCELQVHFIYNGVGEQMFFIFPDGTTMLVDCGACDMSTRPPAPIPSEAAGRGGAFVADYVRRVNPNPDPGHVDYFMLSHYHVDHFGGLSEALKTLRFSKVFDRTYPDVGFPCRIADYGKTDLASVTDAYETMKRRDGTVIEKWRVGASDQLELLHGGAAGFSAFGLCANGFVADERTGEVVDCYATYPDKQPDFSKRQWINENGMSVGFILRYGAFRLYSAGDFSDCPYGANVEDMMADRVLPVTVAKINHHGFKAMFPKLTAALRPAAWVNCTWNRRQPTDDVIALLSDRKLYPADRKLYATHHPSERPLPELASPLSYEGAHVVLTVAPGGRDYRFDLVKA